MAYIIDGNGNITCYQGDTIVLPISGLDTSKNYTLYFQVRNSQRKIMGVQQSMNTNNLSDVLFVVPATVTDTLTVPAGEETETYYYGIKAVFGSVEDTLFLGEGADFATENTITVYPKKVEGA